MIVIPMPDDGSTMTAGHAPPPPVAVLLPAPAPPAATRAFGGPEDFPPENFAAYGIVVTRDDPTGAAAERYSEICMGFADALLSASDAHAPTMDLQLVTVWPVVSRELAALIELTEDRAAQCDAAARHYDRSLALATIREAESGSAELRGELTGRRGPFLLAWNPSDEKGRPDVPVFRADLSNVQTREQARIVFEVWRRDILDNADLWVDGWSDPGVRNRLRLFLENRASTFQTAAGDAFALIGLVGD